MTICNINEFLKEIFFDKKIMSLDIGSKNFGIAFSDPQRKFTLPHKVLIKKKGLFREILKIILEYEIIGLIVGLPLNDNNTENKKCQSIKDITKQLDFFFIENKLLIPICFWDESYSSESARDKIKLIFTTTIKQKKRLDKYAASEILQDFLDYYNLRKNEQKK